MVLKLERVLEQLAEACQPTVKDHQARISVIMRMQALVRSMPNIINTGDVVPYGSFVSGFYNSSSDLDLAVVGWILPRGSQEWIPLERLDAKTKAGLLRKIALRVQDQRMVAGRQNMQLILHARVPIIKFVEAATGIEVDVCIGASGSHLKGSLVRQVSLINPRFGQLFRVVKLWAKAQDINDGATHTLNSWCLTLLVIFFMQQQKPALLPPLYQLFYHSEDNALAHPRLLSIRCATSPDQAFQVCVSRTQAAANEYGSRTPPLLSLFMDFITTISTHMKTLIMQHKGLGRTRLSTWLGRYTSTMFDKPYSLLVEDPFDDEDNPARCLGTQHSCETLAYVSRVFDESAEQLAACTTDDALPLTLARLFGPNLCGLLHVRDLVTAGFQKPLAEWVQRELHGMTPEWRLQLWCNFLEALHCDRPPLSLNAFHAEVKRATKASKPARPPRKPKGSSAALKTDANDTQTTAAAVLASVEQPASELVDALSEAAVAVQVLDVQAAAADGAAAGLAVVHLSGIEEKVQMAQSDGHTDSEQISDGQEAGHKPKQLSARKMRRAEQRQAKAEAYRLTAGSVHGAAVPGYSSDGYRTNGSKMEGAAGAPHAMSSSQAQHSMPNTQPIVFGSVFANVRSVNPGSTQTQLLSAVPPEATSNQTSLQLPFSAHPTSDSHRNGEPCHAEATGTLHNNSAPHSMPDNAGPSKGRKGTKAGLMHAAMGQLRGQHVDAALAGGEAAARTSAGALQHAGKYQGSGGVSSSAAAGPFLHGSDGGIGDTGGAAGGGFDGTAGVDSWIAQQHYADGPAERGRREGKPRHRSRQYKDAQQQHGGRSSTEAAAQAAGAAGAQGSAKPPGRRNKFKPVPGLVPVAVNV